MIDKEEADLLAHAIGLREPGEWVESPYRNNFCADPDGPDDVVWKRLAGRELAKLVATPTRGLPYNTYAVTDMGKRAVALFGAKDAAGNPIVAHVDYYIEDATATIDRALFWGPSNRGYTTDVAKAGRYTGIEAAQIVKNCLTSAPERDDIAWPTMLVAGIVRTHVLRDDLYTRRTNRRASRG